MPRRCTLLAAGAALVFALAAASAATGAGTAATGARKERLMKLHSARTFALALGVDLRRRALARRLAAYDLVVVDGEDTPARALRYLRRRGALVLGYLSVGTVEPDRFWTKRARRYALAPVPGWPERYADVARSGYRKLLVGAVAPRLLARGFDGLFLDNVDVVESYPRLARPMRQLVADIARLVRRRGKLLAAQNADDFTRRYLLRWLDAWNREDVSWRYDFERRAYAPTAASEHARALATVRRLRANGLVVTVTDYPPPGDSSAAQTAVQAACSAGALPWISDIALRTLPATPPRCAATEKAR
ncbi:hypothetical protein HRbin41_00281 [bacterium HR41]|nr:hypothetical protein HRbin41_00281 [bacterium HR41]